MKQQKKQQKVIKHPQIRSKKGENIEREIETERGREREIEKIKQRELYVVRGEKREKERERTENGDRKRGICIRTLHENI